LERIRVAVEPAAWRDAGPAPASGMRPELLRALELAPFLSSVTGVNARTPAAAPSAGARMDQRAVLAGEPAGEGPAATEGSSNASSFAASSSRCAIEPSGW